MEDKDQLLKEAAATIKELRSHVNLMSAKLEVFEKCFSMTGGHRNMGLFQDGTTREYDLVYRIEKVLMAKSSIPGDPDLTAKSHSEP